MNTSIETALAELTVLAEKPPAFDATSSLPALVGTTIIPRIGPPVPTDLPRDMQVLWERTDGARIHEDLTFGQSGLVLWSHADAVVRTSRERGARAEYVDGDLVVGEFLGDADLVVVRIDPRQPDFGFVLIAEPIYGRPDWPVAATGIGDFLLAFIRSGGEKYWE